MPLLLPRHEPPFSQTRGASLCLRKTNNIKMAIVTAVIKSRLTGLQVSLTDSSLTRLNSERPNRRKPYHIRVSRHDDPTHSRELFPRYLSILVCPV